MVCSLLCIQKETIEIEISLPPSDQFYLKAYPLPSTSYRINFPHLFPLAANNRNTPTGKHHRGVSITDNPKPWVLSLRKTQDLGFGVFSRVPKLKNWKNSITSPRKPENTRVRLGLVRDWDTSTYLCRLHKHFSSHRNL